MNNLSVWGDNWWIENDKVWFVWGMENILCSIDLKTHMCEFSVCIPDRSLSRFRISSFCMKYQNDIYCMPVKGKSIWVYNTIDCKFSEIFIDGSDKILVNMRDFWEVGGKIYAVSNGLKQIIEINPIEKKIVKRYCLNKEGSIIKSVKVGSSIYSLLGELGEIYEFNLITKEINKYRVPDIGRRFYTFCYDGDKFWLSGQHKEVYVWNKEKNIIEIVGYLPKEFGIYNYEKDTDGKADNIAEEYKSPAFLYSVTVGHLVWFIPYMTNKIIFVDKETYTLQAFEIDEEIETKESILERNSLCYKYLLEYIRENRYLGIFSVKNNCILEIDTVLLKYEYKKYKYCISDRCLKECSKTYSNVFYEGNAWDREIYNGRMRLEDNDIHSIDANRVGTDIHMRIAYSIR